MADVSFEEFFENHNSVMLAIEPKSGKIFKANKAASAFYNYTIEELQSKNIKEFNQLTPEQVAEEIKRAQKEKRNFFIFRHKTGTGDVKTVEVRSKPFELNNKVVLISVIHDISKQRSFEDQLWHYQQNLENMVDAQTSRLEMQNRVIIILFVVGLITTLFLIYRLKTALEKQKETAEIAEEERTALNEIIWGTDIGTWQWNIQTGETKFNERWAEIIGYSLSELEPTTIETWQTHAHPDDLVLSDSLLTRHFNKESEYYELECRMKHKDGHWVWIYDRGRVVEWTDTGRPLRMSGTHADITTRKQLAIALEKAKSEAIEANRAKSDFLANMSHELRTPMMGIRGVLDLLRENPEVVKHAESLLRDLDVSSQTLMALLDDILDISKIEAGKLDLKYTVIEPAGVVGSIVNVFSIAASQNGVLLTTNAKEHEGYFCETDDIRFRQIVTNLISNAVKFTEKGNVTVNLEIDDRRTPNFLTVSVADTGVGMSEEELQKVFSRFEQAETGRTRKHGGTGLGLAICKELVDLLRGTIDVQSRPDEGSTFSFRLPVKPSKGVEPSIEQDEPIGLRILLAEDNDINQKIVSSMLQKKGHEVIVVENGLRAVEYSMAHKVDVILMDMHMPVMDGLEATRKIRSDCPVNGKTPIIAFTADALSENRQKFLEAGVDSVVTKPLKLDQLQKEIAGIIGYQHR
ncbi:PAS domain-containing protein [Sneathiella sp. P13V-1]|uniref:PAS domain-containing hybrid sensor histidine kinase/response regulator n=1 Tax=Sneathiella sp. P13V-1 TaxID=2697366 RepID=UPI00187B7803|nr:PAS domain-containing hybrid sensor histidine kinase/response regulator [Sneathiella sp. P13V-1]MBE7636865.1 PAS domain-containing protein [Sneathiella sp. P13V-1]